MKARPAFTVKQPDRADVRGADDDEYELNMYDRRMKKCIKREAVLHD